MRPVATAGTGSETAVDRERFPAAVGPTGRSSTQNGRMFDTPCFVTSRSGYMPTAAPEGSSTFTRSFAGSLVLLASVGKVALPGRPVTATGSVRLVPVRVISTAEPGVAPIGWGRLTVGDCGFGGMIDGAGGWPAAVPATRPAKRTDNATSVGIRRKSIGILGRGRVRQAGE